MAKPLINEMRKKRKMSQYRLAKELGIHVNNVKRILAPNYDAKISMLTRCAKVFRCRVRDLIKE